MRISRTLTRCSLGLVTTLTLFGLAACSGSSTDATDPVPTPVVSVSVPNSAASSDAGVEATTDPAAVASTEATGDPDFYDGTQLGTAFDALATAIGADDPQVVQVAVYPTYVIVQAVDPAKPTELNEWTYRDGAVGASTPMDYGSDVKALKQNLFDLSQLEPDAVASFHASALKQSKIDGASIDSLVVQRNIPFTTDIQMSAPVTSDRASKTATGDLDGTVVKIA